MESKIKDTKSIEKDNIFQDENGQYKKNSIKWVKVAISLTIVIVVIISIILTWGYGFGGFSFSKFKNESENIYKQIYVEHNSQEYFENTNSVWTEEAKQQVLLSEQELKENNYSYSEKSYAVESSKKVSNNEYYIAITDKTRTKNDDPDNVKPSPTIFIHEKMIDGKINILDTYDVYEEM